MAVYRSLNRNSERIPRGLLEQNGFIRRHCAGNPATRSPSPAAQEVQMEMKNHLPPTALHVEDQFVTCVGDALLFCHSPSFENHFRYDFTVSFIDIIDASNVSCRND